AKKLNGEILSDYLCSHGRDKQQIQPTRKSERLPARSSRYRQPARKRSHSVLYRWLSHGYGRLNAEEGKMWPGTESNCRHEDFQSCCRSGTMCHHRSLLVSIQAFNGGFRSPILPIRTHSVI